jgi:hypothetical protein
VLLGEVAGAHKRAQYGQIRPPVTVPKNAGITYAEAMTKIRGKVNLDELDIMDIRPRRMATGALILEIPGRKVVRRPRSWPSA